MKNDINCEVRRVLLSYTEKRNLVIITKRILFSVLVQYLVSITKHNHKNQPFDNK